MLPEVYRLPDVRVFRFNMGKGAKIATVIAKMDNFGTRNFEGAKPYTINQNGANLVILKIGVKFDR